LAVHLASDSRASDASLIALADAVKVAEGVRHWLIVGGHMVNLHILRAGLGIPLRITRDADLGVDLRTLRSSGLVGRLRLLGYDNTVYSNRFDRNVDGLEASIDLVIPSKSTKHQPNIDADVIAADGMPALDVALSRDPVVVDLVADLSDGTRIQASVRIPDVISAIAMKSFAIAERDNPRDAQDLAHLLSVIHTDGFNVDRWPTATAFVAAARQLSAQFDTPGTALTVATPIPSQRDHLRVITRLLVGRPR
jgi:hypothetical protein